MCIRDSYIGIHVNGKTTVTEYRYTGKRNQIRERAAFYALDLLRKALQDEA